MLNAKISELFILHFDNKICHELGTKFPLFYYGEKDEVYSRIINLPKVIQLVSAKPNLI